MKGWLYMVCMLLVACAPGPRRAAAPEGVPQAVQRGLQWLHAAPWDMQTVYLYAYLRPRMGWPALPADAHTEQARDSLRRDGGEPAAYYLLAMDLFERLRNPQYGITAGQLQRATELDAITVPALYCDLFPPDTTHYFPVLRQELAAGDYRSTHALLAWVWMQDQACLSPRILRSLRPQMVQAVREVLAHSPDWGDLNLEAAALLRAAGEPADPAWIRETLRTQHPDGSWGKHSKSPGSDPHATLLALWFLAQ